MVATSLAATLCDAIGTCRRVPLREKNLPIDANKRTRRSSPSQFLGGQSELPRLRFCEFREPRWDGRSRLNSVEVAAVAWIGKILHFAVPSESEVEPPPHVIASKARCSSTR